ncbi:MAG: integrase [Solirubrobacteraceae bacterium]|nr:integrase [Solirubrobacteraceae bacterium]
MARRLTGRVVERKTSLGLIYALRFTAYGKRQYVTLGSRDEGWTRSKADDELQNVLADVRRGVWRPPSPPPMPETADPTFHEFASEWLASRRDAIAPSTWQSYRNELVCHLLPFFHRHRLSQITVAEVDRYREYKVREGRMAHSYINATITRLGTILDVADERELITRNPVRVNPRNRKLKVRRVRRAYLDRPEQIEALIAAAGELDAEAHNRADRDTCLRRPMIATLIFAGLRIGEALALRWRDVDLAGGRLRIAGSKTEAGVRWVPLMPALRDELAERKASAEHTRASDKVFSTLTGGMWSRDNARKRIFDRAVELADEMLEAAGLAPTPEGLTPHSLRHTYISLRVAIGDDPATVAQDAGHADMAVTFRIYTHVMRFNKGDRERLRALVEGVQMALIGTGGLDEGLHEPSEASLQDAENTAGAGLSGDSWGETRTPDLTIMSRAL